jgi:class 3 adenylate cyclase
MGDGLMAMLNAPLACNEPAQRAVEMALAMQQRVQALVVQWRAKGHEIGFGVGVATGEAVVGCIGYEGRVDYTAIGNVVNLAARICAEARDGQVLTDHNTSIAVDTSIGFDDIGERTMKGFTKPVLLFSAKPLNRQ